MDVHEVFTPGRYPEYTYVERDQGEYESHLKFHLKKPPTLVSFSGPSKSGKTVLLKNVVNQLDYELIRIHGSNIDSIEGLWNEVLDELNAPTSREIIEETQDETQGEGKAGVSLPGVRADAGATKRHQDSSTETTRHDRRGLRGVLNIIDPDEYVLFIDDAHYIEEESHEQISQGIKEAYERGLSICVGYIPYRSEDLTRANPDLSGRIESFSLDYWEIPELKRIGEKGFKHLNVEPSELVLRTLAIESVGSPQLMQRLCLEMCNVLNILEPVTDPSPVQPNTDDIRDVLQRTAENIDKSTTFEILCGDTSQSGNSRKKYDFRFKGQGDVYDVILRAVASGEPSLSLDQKEIIRRVNEVCRDDTPRTGNITKTIKRMDKWISEKNETSDFVFEWNEERRRLEIPDPELVFYLRWSDKLDVEPKLQ